MGKRLNFERALEVDLRWPQIGDVPFAKAENRKQNARIAEDGFVREML